MIYIYKVFVVICPLMAPECQLLEEHNKRYQVLDRCMEKSVTLLAEIKKETPSQQVIAWCRGFKKEAVTNVAPGTSD